MFNPHLEPKDLTDEQLESKIKDVTLRINQASRMNNTNLYQQLLAIIIVGLFSIKFAI